MDLGKQILFFFSALGAFNGLVLSCYFFFFVRKKQLSNYFLGAFLLALSMRVGKSVVYYFHHDIPILYLQIGLSACFFIGPFHYFFLKASLENLKSLPNAWKVHIGILASIILIGGFALPYPQYPHIWRHYIIPFIYTQWGVYLLFSGFLLKDIFKKALSTYADLRAYDIWIFSIFMSNLLIFLAYIWGFWGGLYISASIIFSLVIYIGVFILMYHKKAGDLFSMPTAKYANKKVNEEDAQLILHRLEKVMKEKEIYKNPNLKLNDLAKEINISGHQLSQLLNDNLDKNFTLFINEYRINEACKILSSEHNLTIEAISDEVGFNSKSTFFSVFKKLKGTTPALYQQSMVKI